MFVNDFFTFGLLAFAALLCVFGVVIFIDGSIRLIRGYLTRTVPRSETDFPHERAAQRDARQTQENKEKQGKEIAA